MKEPVDHILRPRLPWRDDVGAITECGFDASKVKTLTREQYFARLKDMGQQRTALLTCMTCGDTARRWGGWDEDPRLAMQREIEWERGGRYYHDEKRGHRLKDELTAIAALIDAHREEFASLLAAMERQREWLAKKEALRLKRPPAKEPSL